MYDGTVAIAKVTPSRIMEAVAASRLNARAASRRVCM